MCTRKNRSIIIMIRMYLSIHISINKYKLNAQHRSWHQQLNEIIRLLYMLYSCVRLFSIAYKFKKKKQRKNVVRALSLEALWLHLMLFIYFCFFFFSFSTCERYHVFDVNLKRHHFFIYSFLKSQSGVAERK